MRVFKIMRELPMELQMVLCHRLFGSTLINILSKHSEPAFASYARLFAKEAQAKAKGEETPKDIEKSGANFCSQQ